MAHRAKLLLQMGQNVHKSRREDHFIIPKPSERRGSNFVRKCLFTRNTTNRFQTDDAKKKSQLEFAHVKELKQQPKFNALDNYFKSVEENSGQSKNSPLEDDFIPIEYINNEGEKQVIEGFVQEVSPPVLSPQLDDCGHVSENFHTGPPQGDDVCHTSDNLQEENGQNLMNQLLREIGFAEEEPTPATPSTPPQPETPLAAPLQPETPAAPRKQKEPRAPKSSRKRAPNPSTWKKNIMKEKLNSGQEFTNGKGNVIPARSVQPGCGLNCRFKCEAKLTYEERQAIHNDFWKLGNHTRQWDFISHHVSSTSPLKSKIEDSRKKFSNKFFFNVNGCVVFICRRMFLSVLNVSATYVKTALSKLRKNNCTISPDKRGATSDIQKRRAPQNVVQSVAAHIKKYPLVESHYCRKTSQRKYLHESLSVREMYRSYVKWMDEKNPTEKKASETMYRHIFNYDFNLSFFKPKKDQCDLCNTFNNASASQKKKLLVSYNFHLENKTKSRELVKSYKNLAMADNKNCYACFDLQKVLSIPKAETSVLFYMRKWSCYNFTIYDGGKHEGHCYFWDESQGRRGANEIASGLFVFMQNAKTANGYENFFFVSDNCSGQNKNRIVFAMMYHASLKLSVKITHIFLQTGHTQNEGDTMHSIIEREASKENVYVPEQWVDIIINSKKTGKQFTVTKLKDHILDFKPLMNSMQWKKDSNQSAVQWKKCKEVTFDALNSPGKVYVRYNLASDDKVEIPIVPIRRGNPVNYKTFKLLPAYNAPLKLPVNKLKDFAKMCKKLTIPENFQAPYKSLDGFPQEDYLDSEDEIEEGVTDHPNQPPNDAGSESDDQSTDYEDWLIDNPDTVEKQNQV